LRFIPLLLRRTLSAPRDTGFARLDIGLFSKSSIGMTFCELINFEPETIHKVYRRGGPGRWRVRGEIG
jgi:hypothetical protein